MAESEFYVTVRAKGYQTWCVRAKSKREAIEKCRDGDAEVEPVIGEIDFLCWSTAVAHEDKPDHQSYNG